MYNFEEFYKEYSKLEYSFIDDMSNAFNTEKTTKEEDVNGYDVKLSFYIDVKAQKKTNRYDSESDPNINWLEIRKENGLDGWVFGEKKLIAFENNNEWIIITPKKLQQFISEYRIKERTTNRDDFYKFYTRKGKINELLMRVKTDDLKKYAFNILPKNTEEKITIDDFFLLK